MGFSLFSLIKEISVDRLNFIINEISSESGDLRIRIDSLAVKDQRLRGIFIDDLLLCMRNFKIKENGSIDIKDSGIAVERLILKISQNWINGELENFQTMYEEQGFRDIEIQLLHNMMVIRGSYKKGLSFPFSVEIKTGINHNKLFIELFHFNLLEMVPLPDWFQNTLMNLVSSNVKIDFVEIDKSSFYIDILKAISFPVEISLRDFRVEKDFLVLEV